MRLEGVAKGGYYPTPTTMVRKILARLSFSGQTRLIDPCCGEGDALALVASAAPQGSEAYGIELDGHRAEEAGQKLTKVVQCAYEVARVEPQSMQIMFLNPPYDSNSGQEGEANRKELIFLRDLSKVMAADGILVFVIPRYTLKQSMVQALFNRYSDLAVYRFDDEEYSVYKQVVVFGRRRAGSVKRFNDEEKKLAKQFLTYGLDLEAPMPYLDDEDDDRVWSVPFLEEMKPIKFRGYLLDKEEMIKDLATSDAFKIATNMLNSTVAITNLSRPPLPFRRTHMATLIAAGALNGSVGVGDNRHMVVGITRKVTETETTTADNGDVIVIESEKYVTAVRTIEQDGTILDLM
ncbi:DUF6094 domain-containing protein [Alicyclobacillus fodiniaquatilis]|uniref:DUF6094 domain-containing protein n=1 Tax=Alicyclobacillus fodiniaquatilis TaxID=1661150 RepID=A0ABW4JJU3_9BACL